MFLVQLQEFYICNPHPMYVQQWDVPNPNAPAAKPKAIFIHGGAHTGVVWTQCPDGRAGWARHLAQLGWTCFVVDWPGTGRSADIGDFLTSGPVPIVTAICDLLQKVGPALLIAHSIGVPIAMKSMEKIPRMVTGLVAIAPAPQKLPAYPPGPLNTQVIFFDDQAVKRQFTNAPNFPASALADYKSSLCAMSPSVFNAVASQDGSSDLVADVAKFASVPTIVIAGDHDQLVPAVITKSVAEALGTRHVLVGQDWVCRDSAIRFQLK